MAIIVNGQRIEESAIAEEMQMLKMSGGGCGCGDDCGCDDSDDDCGCGDEGCGDDCGCGDGCGCGDEEAPSDDQVRREAESRLVVRALMEQEAMSQFPASDAGEVKEMIMNAVAQAGSEAAFLRMAGLASVDDPQLCRTVDLSLRVSKLIESIGAKVALPSMAEVKKFYQDMGGEFEDDAGKKMAFEDISDALQAELFDEAKNAAFEDYVRSLLQKAKIEQV